MNPSLVWFFSPPPLPPFLFLTFPPSHVAPSLGEFALVPCRRESAAASSCCWGPYAVEGLTPSNYGFVLDARFKRNPGNE
jgi:hypothetical protein